MSYNGRMFRSNLAISEVTPEGTIEIVKEVVKDDQGVERTRYKGTSPNFPDLTPRYGAARIDVVESVRRQQYTYYASGDAARANEEK